MKALGTKLALILALGAGVTGCASTVPRNAPDWYRQAIHNEAHGYPDLRNVPRTYSANNDAAHWAAVQADVVAAGQAMRTNPRNEPAPALNPDAFVDDARAAIDATRTTHEGH